jgi:hypothetical protein
VHENRLQAVPRLDVQRAGEELPLQGDEGVEKTQEDCCERSSWLMDQSAG